MEQNDTQIQKNRMLILISVILLTFMACLDGSIVNVALPTMAAKLTVSMEAISWVVTSYLIVIAALILIFGRLGDIKGNTRVFKYGVVGFTLASLLCGISNSLPLLIAARILQAIGAAAAMATNQGIIVQVFPRNERGRALGISGSAVALGTLVGPPLGGFIVAALHWNYIFLINVPIGIGAFLLGMKFLPKAKPVQSHGERFDVKGALLFILATVALFGSILTGETLGYTHPLIITGFVIATVTLVAFILTEKKRQAPLLELKIFTNTLFSLSLFCAFISFLCINSSSIILPFYFQDVLKFSPATAGLLLAISPIVLSVVAPASGHLSDKIGSEFLTFLGLLLTSLGLFLYASMNEYSPVSLLIIFIVIQSIGNGLFQSPNTSLIMSSVPKDKVGVAGSVNALVRNLGMVMGICLSTALLYNRMSTMLGYHVTDYVPGRNDAFIYGMRFVFITVAIICLVGALLTLYRLYGKRKSRARTIPNEINE